MIKNELKRVASRKPKTMSKADMANIKKGAHELLQAAAIQPFQLDSIVKTIASYQQGHLNEADAKLLFEQVQMW